MNERPFTRPQAADYRDVENWNDEVDRRGNYNRNNNNVTFSDKGKTALAIALAVSCVLMAMMYYEMREVAQEQRLKQYNLDWFRTHEFSELNDKVAVEGKMIDFLQTKTACAKGI